MKLYVDELRPAPPGWKCVDSTAEAIMHLGSGQVVELSLASNARGCTVCREAGCDDLTHACSREVLAEMIRTGVWPREKPVVHGPEGDEAELLRDRIEAYWRPRSALEGAPRFVCAATYGDDAAEVMGWYTVQEAVAAFARGRWRLVGRPASMLVTALEPDGRTERRFLVACAPGSFVPEELGA